MSKWVLVMVWAGTAALATSVGVGALSFVAGGIDTETPLVAVQENSPSGNPASTPAPQATESKDDSEQLGSQTSSGNSTGGSINTKPQQSAGSNSSADDSNKPRPSTTPGPIVQSGFKGSDGGSVTMRCTGRVAELVAWVPLNGFRVLPPSVDDDEVEIQFESNSVRWEIKGKCEDSGPVFEEPEMDEIN